MSTPQAQPQTPQARLLAFILAGVFYALGVFFFIGDTIERLGTDLQKQYSSPDDPLTILADFVRGLGAFTSDKTHWVIPCILLGVGLTTTGYLIKEKK